MPQKCKRVCKPGSVLDGHQSTRAIANALQPPPENGRAGLVFSHGVAPDRVYSDGQFPAVGCALTAPFHPYHCGKTAVIRVERCPRPLIKGRSVAAGNDCNRERQISPASFHTIPRFPVPLRDYREHRHSLFLTSTVLPQWRYISVALFLKSPSAGVTRYPCPVEPGLSSWTAFRPAHATVCFTRPFILQERGRLVNG